MHIPFSLLKDMPSACHVNVEATVDNVVAFPGCFASSAGSSEPNAQSQNKVL